MCHTFYKFRPLSSFVLYYFLVYGVFKFCLSDCSVDGLWEPVVGRLARGSAAQKHPSLKTIIIIVIVGFNMPCNFLYCSNPKEFRGWDFVLVLLFFFFSVFVDFLNFPSFFCKFHQIWVNFAVPGRWYGLIDFPLSFIYLYF